MGRVGIGAALASAFALTIATAAPLFASERAPASRGEQIRDANYSVRQTSDIASRILALHNAERRRLRVPDLAWNPHLEREAAEWAEYLSRREVGCAVATARGNDVLVCRYYPAGNVMGRRAH